MLEPSHIVVKPFKSLKTLKVSVKRIWLFSIPIYSALVNSKSLKNTILKFVKFCIFFQGVQI